MTYQDKDYLVIYAEAERQARHLLFVNSSRYNGVIENMIEDVLRETAFRVPADVLKRVTAIDLRDTCMGAAYEVNVERHHISA